MNDSIITGLRSGHGLAAREVSFADSRTVLRACQEPAGFNLLSHYAPDSWCPLSLNTLRSEHGLAMTWTVDDLPHRFEWVEAFPFGCVNREPRATGELQSRVVVEEGLVQWQLTGVVRTAVFRIPRAMFVESGTRDASGRPQEVCQWVLGNTAPWQAVRHEEWQFRDSSTYAGIAGRAVAPEPRRSELHLAIRAAAELSVATGADTVQFTLTPDAAGRVTLVIGIGSDAKAAARLAEQGCAAPDAAWQRQMARYAQVVDEIPAVAFGRHSALNRFAGQQPLYMESLRITDTPGASRAKNEYGSVWGWDMTRPAFGLLCANRHRPVRDLLIFRASQLNADGTLINQYDSTLTRDLRVSEDIDHLEYMLAHDYLAWSGDESVLEELRPWLLHSVRRVITLADPGTGMVPAIARSTDFPEEFGRTFKAWLAYDTGWAYGGYCAAEKLLLKLGENELAAAIREVAARVRGNFVRVFWNERAGFWNEGVHPTDPDLVCDIPLQTAMAGMDSPYGEDLYGERLATSAAFAAEHFLREDGLWLTARGETRGWKEWTRQANNWYAANDTQIARLLRATGNSRALERLFYLYEWNFGQAPYVFEGKPFFRPLNGSCAWYGMSCGAWYRNLVECAAGLWADLGGLGLMPGGLGEPITIKGLRFRDATIHFSATGQGHWPRRLLLDGQPLVGTTKFPAFTPGAHRIEVEYGPSVPAHPVLTLAVDAVVQTAVVEGQVLRVELQGQGYTPLSFFAPTRPVVHLNAEPLTVEWDPLTGTGRARALMHGNAILTLAGV